MKRNNLLYKQIRNKKTDKPYSELVESKIILYFILRGYITTYKAFKDFGIYNAEVLTIPNLKYLVAVLDRYKMDKHFLIGGNFRLHLKKKGWDYDNKIYDFRNEVYLSQKDIGSHLERLFEEFEKIEGTVKRILPNLNIEDRDYIEFKK